MLELSDVRLNARCDQGFSHSFAAGEIAVVLGANQAGKTDLCRLIAGLNTRAGGVVRFGGLDLSGLKPQRRSVSMVYQAFVNYPNLTVAENIASPMRAQRMDAGERRKRVDKYADMLQISDLLARLPHELSGGQQQRLAIARALAKGAQVLLLDEPLVNLDFKLRESLQNELRNLLQSTNTVVIYTSSEPRDAFALGDQVLLLAEGRKIQAGTPIEVYRSPNSFVAMELLAEPCVNRFTKDGKACALRPEHLRVGEMTSATPSIGFDMSVSAYETNGDESFIHGRVGENEWVVRFNGMLDVSVGSRLNLHANSADVVKF
jgi:glycerol transport system ATP-binding protein